MTPRNKPLTHVPMTAPICANPAGTPIEAPAAMRPTPPSNACRFCAAPVSQWDDDKGRPILFCSDGCRKADARSLVARGDVLESLRVEPVVDGEQGELG